MSEKDQDFDKLHVYFRFMELVLIWDWRLTTKHLCANFQIDRQKAQRIIKNYLKFNENSIEHSPLIKGYVPSESFEPKVVCQSSAGMASQDLHKNINRYAETLSDYFVYANSAYDGKLKNAKDTVNSTIKLASLGSPNILLSYNVPTLPTIEATINPEYIRCIRYAIGRDELLEMEYTSMMHNREISAAKISSNTQVSKWRVIKPIHLTKTPDTMLLGAIEIQEDNNFKIRYLNFNVSRINSIRCGLKINTNEQTRYRLQDRLATKLLDSGGNLTKDSDKVIKAILSVNQFLSAAEVENRINKIIEAVNDKSESENIHEKAIQLIAEYIHITIEKIVDFESAEIDIVLCSNPNYDDGKRETIINEFGLTLENPSSAPASQDMYIKTIHLPKYELYSFNKLYRYPRYQLGISSLFSSVQKNELKWERTKTELAERQLRSLIFNYAEIYRDFNHALFELLKVNKNRKSAENSLFESADFQTFIKVEKTASFINTVKQDLQKANLEFLDKAEAIGRLDILYKYLEFKNETEELYKFESVINSLEADVNRLYCMAYRTDRFMIDLLDSGLVIRNHRQIDASFSDKNTNRYEIAYDEKLLHLNVVEKLEFISDLNAEVAS